MRKDKQDTQNTITDATSAPGKQTGRAPYGRPKFTVFGKVARLTGDNASGSLPDATHPTMGQMAMMM